jgi:hypothetical protein
MRNRCPSTPQPTYLQTNLFIDGFIPLEYCNYGARLRRIAWHVVLFGQRLERKGLRRAKYAGTLRDVLA